MIFSLPVAQESALCVHIDSCGGTAQQMLGMFLALGLPRRRHFAEHEVVAGATTRHVFGPDTAHMFCQAWGQSLVWLMLRRGLQFLQLKVQPVYRPAASAAQPLLGRAPRAAAPAAAAAVPALHPPSPQSKS